MRITRTFERISAHDQSRYRIRPVVLYFAEATDGWEGVGNTAREAVRDLQAETRSPRARSFRKERRYQHPTPEQYAELTALVSEHVPLNKILEK